MGDNGKEMIGGYELIALIGDGAQGRVYRARCVSDSLPYVKRDEEVALKVVRMTGEDDKQRLKFQEQADILRRLSHSSIVSYRDCFTWHPGEWDEAQCLVMELLEGEPLNERLKKSASGLSWPQVEVIFEQCLSGLIHARERGITHRDIKPSNIFLTNDGQAKLIDFDIARRDDSAQMSTAGWKGTFDYMAPDFITVENFRGDEVSDIFSLGVCFYQALTGALPFDALGETAHIGYLNRWRGSLAPTPSFRPGVFRVLAHARNVIVRAVAMQREERYATFAAMLEDFRKIRHRRIRHKNKEEYELLAVLGRGGFGEVFKARRASDGLLVAVKYLFSEKQSERFIKEAKILQQYSHHSLVKYVDFMVIEGTGGDRQYFLVMEFLEGMPGWTLRYRIKHEGALDVQEVVVIFGRYLEALHFLHTSARPIIHRDIKPGNLYAPVGQPESAKIFDLGVARDVTGTVTVGGVPGTLDYMAPEFGVAGGDRGSPQSDLYALGLCLYESLTGKPVFGRLPTDINSAWLAFQDRIRKPPEIAFDAPVFVQYPAFKQIVLKTLADNPAARYRSALEMRVALEAAIKPTTELPEDDFLDGGEMTMATFNGAQPLPEPGATLGTRPLEMVAADVAVKGLDDFVASGREVAQKRKRRKYLIITGTAAALLVLFAGGIYTSIRIISIITRKLSKERSEVVEKERERVSTPESVGEQRSPESAVAVKEVPLDIDKSKEPVALPEPPVAALPEQPVKQPEPLTPLQKEPAADTPHLATKQAETVVPKSEQTVKERATATPQPDVAAQQALALVRQKEAAEQQQKEAAQQQQRELEERLGKQLADFDVRLAKGQLDQCIDGVNLLTGILADMAPNSPLREKLNVTRIAYLKLLAESVVQKEPLAERAKRLEIVGELLKLPGATVLFGTETAMLRRGFEQQSNITILRVSNRSDALLKLSAKELGAEVELAAQGAHEWLVPVRSDDLQFTLTVRGAGANQTRGESIKLARASGVEKTLAGFAKVAEEQAKPDVAQAAVVEPQVKKEPTPEPTKVAANEPVKREATVEGVKEEPPQAVVLAADVAPPAAEAAGESAFEIAVSPKNATMLINGDPAAPGRVVVKPNENYQIMVSCKGYKSVQQYYKVKSGETRRIDILLEREQKRSLFGF